MESQGRKFLFACGSRCRLGWAAKILSILTARARQAGGREAETVSSKSSMELGKDFLLPSFRLDVCRSKALPAFRSVQEYRAGYHGFSMNAMHTCGGGTVSITDFIPVSFGLENIKTRCRTLPCTSEAPSFRSCSPLSTMLWPDSYAWLRFAYLSPKFVTKQTSVVLVWPVCPSAFASRQASARKSCFQSLDKSSCTCYRKRQQRCLSLVCCAES